MREYIPLLGVGIWIAAWLSPPQKGISHPWIRWKPLQYQYCRPHPATSESECQHLKYIWGQKSNLTRYRLKHAVSVPSTRIPKTLYKMLFFLYFETTKFDRSSNYLLSGPKINFADLSRIMQSCFPIVYWYKILSQYLKGNLFGKHEML